jgi:RNA recognition motif-containing protein
MSNKLYVGNLSYDATEDQIVELFSAVCRPRRVKMMMDRETGLFRGFAFVEVGTSFEAKSCIDKLHQTRFGGRKIIVNEAKERGTTPKV